jgi:hypothetical protein
MKDLFVEDEYIVRLTSPSALPSDLAVGTVDRHVHEMMSTFGHSDFSLLKKYHVMSQRGLHLYHARLSSSAVTHLRSLPGVEYVEHNHKVSIS